MGGKNLPRMGTYGITKNRRQTVGGKDGNIEPMAPQKLPGGLQKPVPFGMGNQVPMAGPDYRFKPIVTPIGTARRKVRKGNITKGIRAKENGMGHAFSPRV